MRVLLLVDIQNDFLPGGALAVPRGDEVVPVANAMMSRFDLTVATQDWHPPDHVSFADNYENSAVGDVIDVGGQPQILWPRHCVQGTPGADFAAGLDLTGVGHVVRKGADPRIDSYSGFFDNDHRSATGLGDYLQSRDVREVHVMGLATDYCVAYTALDAVSLGFETHLIEEGCRGVEMTRGDVQRAVESMREAGVTIESSDDA